MESSASQDGSAPPRKRAVLARLRVGLLSAALTVGMASAIIWAKLRLVGDVPRTVYAEPDPAQSDTTGTNAEPEPVARERERADARR